MKKYWLTYSVELIVAVILISISIKVFLVYAFIATMIGLDRKVDYLRKLIRVFQVANESKIIAIAKKLGVTEEDITQVYNENTEKLTSEQAEGLRKDLEDIVKS